MTANTTAPMTDQTSTPRYIEATLFLILMSIGAWLRLGWVGISHFALDEVNISLPALQMARGEAFVFLGTFSSVGVPFFPTGTWAFVPPFLFSTDPLLATRYVGVLNLLAMVGLYALVRKIFGIPSALIALAMLALAPYAVIHSRFIWQPNLLIPITVVWMLALEASFSSEKRPRLMTVLAIFIAGISIQIHFAGLGIGVATALYALYQKWWQRWLACIVGGVLVITMTLPFFGYLACCGDPILSAIQDTASETASTDTLSLQQAMRVGFNVGWEEKIIGDLATNPSWYAHLASAITVLLFAMGILSRVQHRKHTPQTHLAIIAGLLLVCMPLVFVFISPVRFYYMLPVIPAIAIFAGAGWHLVQNTLYRGAIVVATGAFVLASTIGLAQHLTIATTEATPHGIGVPLAYTRDVAYGFPDENVVYHTHGDITTRTGQAMIFEAYWHGQDNRRVVNGANLLILPPEPSVLLFELRPFQAYEEAQAAGLVSEEMTLPRRENEPDFMVLRTDGTQQVEGYTLLDEPIRFSHGVTLEGWRVRYVGPRLRVSTIWHVDDDLPTATVQQFHHLYLSENGEPVGDAPLLVSDTALSMSTWQIGDRVIVMGDFFPEYDAQYQLAIGHYDLNTGVRFTTVDERDSVILSAFDSGELAR
ncbi:MAG: glycosyltransferase family 39 protein [Chloroflexota bacterium]